MPTGTLIRKIHRQSWLTHSQPAQRWPDDRGNQGRDAEQRQCGALFLRRKTVDQNSLAAGLQSAAGQALNDAEQDHLLQAGRQAAQDAEASVKMAIDSRK